MKKYTSLVIFVCVALCCYSLKGASQEHKKLFYFLSPESLLGVKDEKGAIVIPATHYFLPIAYDDFRLPINDSILILVPKHAPNLKDPKPYGLAYNRNGEVLYAPYLFDNGPDFLEEGLSRYIENGKIGFVNRFGKKMIKAQWDWVSPFEYGIARACNGCFIDYSKDPEHPSLDLSKATTFYIGKNGRALNPIAHKHSEKDQLIDETYIPYQFNYNKFEESLVKKLSDANLISKAYFVNYYSPLTEKEKQLHFEIVEKPTKGFPYYAINAFRYDTNGAYHKADSPDLLFYATERGDIYQIPYGNLQEKILLEEWIVGFDAKAKQFLKEHPDAIHRY